MKVKVLNAGEYHWNSVDNFTAVAKAISGNKVTHDVVVTGSPVGPGWGSYGQRVGSDNPEGVQLSDGTIIVSAEVSSFSEDSDDNSRTEYYKLAKKTREEKAADDLVATKAWVMA